MVSEKQIQANKNNATLSTGPVSRAGKQAVSKNALKHGLLSNESFIDGENVKHLRQLRTSLNAQLRPVGALEGLMVDRIVSSYWRLRRALRVEKEMINGKGSHFGENNTSLGYRFGDEYDGRNRFLKHLRYETAIERQIFRSLHELIRLQMYRSGKRTPAPLAIDLDVSTSHV